MNLHQQVIIEDVANVMKYFDTENSLTSAIDLRGETVLLSESEISSLDLDYGLVKTYNQQQLLEALPQKQTTDHLVAAWNANEQLNMTSGHRYDEGHLPSSRLAKKPLHSGSYVWKPQ